MTSTEAYMALPMGGGGGQNLYGYGRRATARGLLRKKAYSNG